MMKRFTIGFLVGVGMMYWYLHYGEQTLAGTGLWFKSSAAKYRGDQVHRAVDAELGH